MRPNGSYRQACVADRFVPRLMKRGKTPDYGDRAVFGVPLTVSQQRHGQPLPQCVLYAMRRLRRAAADAVGVFRKSGVRSRVAALREQLEADPGECRQRRGHSVYEVYYFHRGNRVMFLPLLSVCLFARLLKKL